MSEAVIRIVADALTGEQPPEPTYVRQFDPDGFDGYGSLAVTKSALRALRFADVAEAWEFSRQQSTIKPFRLDGLPNRPLTAYTLEIMPYVDAVLGKVIL